MKNVKSFIYAHHKALMITTILALTVANGFANDPHPDEGGPDIHPYWSFVDVLIGMVIRAAKILS